MTHEQDVVQQQLSVMLNLIRLTKEKEIEWRPVQTKRFLGQPGKDVYRSFFAGFELCLEEVDNPLKMITKRLAEYYDGSFRLRVIDPASGEDKIVIPPLEAVDDLAAIIRHRLEAQVEAATASEGSMEELKAFNQKLQQAR